MSLQIVKGAEPIPGYRLVRLLGRGGFGEVWEAEAPGGFPKAIKFVYGDLNALSVAPVGAEQEMRSLMRVKGVRHPFLLSLERVDLVGGQLVIVTELADIDLWARFRDCRKQGLPGIPRDELVRYMEETAEVLDLMNQVHDLQHMDIKPQNLCLLHNHIKVADFGLVKDLSGLMASMTGGMTPKYAAPETFRGMVSRFSDQYSLAIVYQEMLTGQAPFRAGAPHEMMRLHTEAPPNLAPLPAPDRAVVGQALAKNVHERHPSCQAFVGKLRQIDRPPAVAVRPAPASGSPVTVRSVPAAPASAERLTPLQRPETPPCIPEKTAEGVLFPALVVGLGHFGLETLRQFRKVLHARSVGTGRLPHLQTLVIDSDPEAIAAALRGSTGEALDRDEVLVARLSRVHRYLRPPSSMPPLEKWISPRALSRMPRNLLTGDSRALGRLALVDNYRNVVNRLESALDRITAPDALQTAARESGLGWRSNWPRAYVVAGLAGGTGSGMFIDLAYIVRAALRDRGYGDAEVIALDFLPSGDDPAPDVAQANTYAALVELHHFTAARFHAQYEAMAPAVEDDRPPFDRTVLLTGDDGPVAAGEYLYRELLTPLGLEAEKARVFEPATLKDVSTCLFFQASGLTVLASPGRRLLRDGLRRLGQGLLDRWMNLKGSDLRAQVRTEVQGQVQEQGLNSQSILADLQAACTRELGKRLEDLISGWLEPATEAAAMGSHDPWRMRKALDQVNRFLGSPLEEAVMQSAPVPAVVERAAEQLGRRYCQVLEGLVMQYLERPGYRLAGVVEAIQHAAALVEREVRAQEPKARELGTRVQQMAESLHAGLADRGLDGGKRKDRGPRPLPLAELAKTLADYPLQRCRHILLQRLGGVCVALRGYLSDRAYTINAHRQTLTALGETLSEFSEGESGEWPRPPSQAAGCAPGEMLDQVMHSLTAEDWLRLDQAVQDALQGGRSESDSVSAALGSPAGQKVLREALVRGVGLFLADRLPLLKNPVEMFLAQYADEKALTEAFRKAFDDAAPVLGGAPVQHPQGFSLLLAPDSAGGDRIGQVVRRTLPETTVACTGSAEEVVFYRECPGLSLEELEQLGLACPEAYTQACSREDLTPHTRLDVAWKPSGGPS
jgi:hypothetical protein